MKAERLSLGPLGTNCYILMIEEEALVVDPGGEGTYLIQWLTERDLSPKAVLLTHAHFDHIGAVDDLRKNYQIPVYLHHAEKDWLQNPEKNGSSLFIGEAITMAAADYYLTPGMLQIGKFHFEVIETPGHSPGSVSFIFHEAYKVFSGDALFRSSIGRTDLPGGSMVQLKDSIKKKLFSLDHQFEVLPGHGPSTTIGYEKENNPFLS